MPLLLSNYYFYLFFYTIANLNSSFSFELNQSLKMENDCGWSFRWASETGSDGEAGVESDSSCSLEGSSDATSEGDSECFKESPL